MINDQEFLHGAAFLRVINYGNKVTITHISWIHPSLYLVETDISKSGILFKLSKKPKSAWSFTFSAQEQSALISLHNKYPESSVFIALICHIDGICCLSEEQLLSVLEESAGISGQRVSVSRRLNGSYHVNGSSRRSLERTVPQSNWPRVVLLKDTSCYE
jgi:hypothetical protein